MGIEAALLAGVAGTTAAGVASQIQQSRAQAEQAEINEAQIRASTAVELSRQRKSARARQGALEAQIGASGATRTGTALSLISDELIEAQLNEAILLSRGGQAAARQANIRRGVRSRGQAAAISTGLQGITQGLLLGGQLSGGNGGSLLGSGGSRPTDIDTSLNPFGRS